MPLCLEPAARAATKRDRINNAKRALIAAHPDFADLEEAVIDLLTDLRHLCDAGKMDMTTLDGIARRHYQHEL